ncbi:MAG: hypothetical protein M1839_009307 [Geoglossum umbratile]|nr:MAG: hypothetical protein M1839_009307 [Geoglossum umbratile]
MVHIKDQIQMYTTNELLSHPLVSPVLQPSLGGLPPLLVLTGGGEVLRDEQIYLAHKAANPTKYPPGDGYLDEDPVARETLAKWKPTNVQLQVWDNCCHATPALSFTHPAKHMYRSIAQFAAWALARAQKTEIEILDDDDVSIASSSSSFSERRSSNRKRPAATSPQAPTARVGRAGDPLPPFHNHMVRQRVGRHGVIYDLDPESDLPVLKIPPSEVGAVKPEPVRRWMEGKKMKDKQFASVRREIQKQRAREIATGFGVLGENPPPSALAGRRKKGLAKDTKRRKSLGMSLWSMWGSSYDGKILQREEKGDKEPEIAVVTSPGGTHARGTGARRSRSRSRRRTVSDTGQAGGDVGEGNDAVAGLSARRESHNSDYLGPPIAPIITITEYSETHPEQGSNQNIGAGRRPFEGPVAYPFKLAYRQGSDMNASTVTLTSEAGVLDPQFDKDDVEATGSEQIP